MPFEVPKGAPLDAKEEPNTDDDDDEEEVEDLDEEEVEDLDEEEVEDLDEEEMDHDGSESDEDEIPPLADSGSPTNLLLESLANGEIQIRDDVESHNDSWVDFDDDGDEESVSSEDSETARIVEEFQLQNEKKKVKAERLFKNKKWKEAAELYYDFIEVLSDEDASCDQDDPQLESRLHLAICHIKLKDYEEALEQLEVVFRFTPEKDLKADIYLYLCECLLMKKEYIQSACVALLGMEKFDQDENLRTLLQHLSELYKPSITELRIYLAELDDFEVKGADLFMFLDDLPDVDDGEYLINPQDYAKDRPNVTIKMDDESAVGSNHNSEEAPSTSSDSTADTSFSPGAIAMVVEKAARAYRAGMFGIAAHEFSKALNQTTFLPADVRYILTYCRSMSHLQSRSLDSIKSGLAELEVLSTDATTRPYIYYGLAKYLMALKKPETEVVEVIEKGTNALNVIKEAGIESSINDVWAFPLLSELFTESCKQDQLLKLFEELEHELKNPATPNAICRHENCHQNITGDLLPARNVIYLTDVDFKGYYTLICQEKCSVDFHSQCWKHLKEEELVSNDKEFLGKECLTPDCLCPVVKIVIVKESGEKKEIEVEDVNSNTNKAPSKWKKNREHDPAEKSSQSQSETQNPATSGEGKQAPVAQASKTIKKPAPVAKTAPSHVPPSHVPPSHVPSPSESIRKAWPPDPDTCAEFTPISLQDLEREFASSMSFSPQLAEMEIKNQHLQEETTKLNAKLSLLEKEKADLAKKLEDARIHSKRQTEEINRLKGDLAAEQQTTNRLLHQNEKYQSEATTLKKNAFASKLSQEYVTWQLAHDESSKYLRLLEYLHGETFLEQSPTLQRCIREYRQTMERAKRQLAVLTVDVNRESVNQIPMPGGLVESDFRLMTAEVDSKMSEVTAKIKSDARQAFFAEQLLAEQQILRQNLMSQPPPGLGAVMPTIPLSPNRHGLAGAAARVSLGVPAPAAPAPAAGGRGQSIDRIVERVQFTYPNMTKEQIVSKIEIVRRNNNGTIKGLTVSTLLDQIGKLIQSQGSAAAYSSSDVGEQECAICMEEMSSWSSLMTLQPCGHKFHHPCIKSWFQEKRDCPLCRNYVVPPDDFPNLQQYSKFVNRRRP